MSTSAKDFPSPTELDARWQGKAPERWHDLEGHSGLRRRIIGFHAQDVGRTALTLHQIRGEADSTRRSGARRVHHDVFPLILRELAAGP